MERIPQYNLVREVEPGRRVMMSEAAAIIAGEHMSPAGPQDTINWHVVPQLKNHSITLFGRLCDKRCRILPRKKKANIRRAKRVNLGGVW